MALYNLSQITANGSSTYQIAQGVNDTLLYGYLGLLWLLPAAVILVVGFYAATQDMKRSVAGSMFITFILAVMLRALSLVSDLVLFASIILFAASLVMVWRS